MMNKALYILSFVLLLFVGFQQLGWGQAAYIYSCVGDVQLRKIGNDGKYKSWRDVTIEDIDSSPLQLLDSVNVFNSLELYLAGAKNQKFIGRRGCWTVEQIINGKADIERLRGESGYGIKSLPKKIQMSVSCPDLLSTSVFHVGNVLQTIIWNGLKDCFVYVYFEDNLEGILYPFIAQNMCFHLQSGEVKAVLCQSALAGPAGDATVYVVYSNDYFELPVFPQRMSLKTEDFFKQHNLHVISKRISIEE